VRGIYVGAVLVVFFLSHVLLSGALTFGRIGPDFILLIVSYFAVFNGALGGSLFGFFVGLFQDLFNPGFLGLNALTKSLVGYGLGRAGAQTERENPLFLLALFGVVAIAHDFIYLLFFTQLHLGRFFIMWVTVSLPSAIYTAVVGALVHTVVTYSMTEVVRYLGKTRP
jgi:rod shape-determining protein MreD